MLFSFSRIPRNQIPNIARCIRERIHGHPEKWNLHNFQFLNQCCLLFLEIYHSSKKIGDLQCQHYLLSAKVWENILEHLPPRNSENILKMVAVLSGGSATPKFSGTGKVASWLWGECNSKLFRCRGLTFCSANVRLMYRQFFTYHCNLLSIWLLNTGACTINGEERPCGQLESKTLCYHKAKVALASRFLFYSPPPPADEKLHGQCPLRKSLQENFRSRSDPSCTPDKTEKVAVRGGGVCCISLRHISGIIDL